MIKTVAYLQEKLDQQYVMFTKLTGFRFVEGRLERMVMPLRRRKGERT